MLPVELVPFLARDRRTLLAFRCAASAYTGAIGGYDVYVVTRWLYSVFTPIRLDTLVTCYNYEIMPVARRGDIGGVLCELALVGSTERVGFHQICIPTTLHFGHGRGTITLINHSKIMVNLPARGDFKDYIPGKLKKYASCIDYKYNLTIIYNAPANTFVHGVHYK